MGIGQTCFRESLTNIAGSRNSYLCPSTVYVLTNFHNVSYHGDLLLLLRQVYFYYRKHKEMNLWCVNYCCIICKKNILSKNLRQIRPRRKLYSYC